MSNAYAETYKRREVSDSAYTEIREFIYQVAGINLGPGKQTLVSSRLNKRLIHNNLDDFDQYAKLLNNRGSDLERQIAVDLLTTNETYFFREMDHFNALRQQVLPNYPGKQPFRVWSAASSSGEEAYSIAMVLDDFFGKRVNWEVFGSDVSSRIVKKAKSGLYMMHRIDAIPQEFLKRYCLKGNSEYDGYLLIDPALRARTSFEEINLTKPLPDIGMFEVIFLRNVLIYFDNETKEKIVRNLLTRLVSQGMLYIGHSESLKSMDLPLQLLAPTVYQKD